MAEEQELHSYLGDGVYAKFDGHGIEIRVNDHRNPVAVYLEPEVLERLNKFYQHQLQKAKDDLKDVPLINKPNE